MIVLLNFALQRKSIKRKKTKRERWLAVGILERRSVMCRLLYHQTVSFHNYCATKYCDKIYCVVRGAQCRVVTPSLIRHCMQMFLYYIFLLMFANAWLILYVWSYSIIKGVPSFAHIMYCPMCQPLNFLYGCMSIMCSKAINQLP